MKEPNLDGYSDAERALFWEAAAKSSQHSIQLLWESLYRLLVESDSAFQCQEQLMHFCGWKPEKETSEEFFERIQKEIER